MILSEKHKFVFIKGRKVAGTSVEVLLSEICGPNDIITPITPFDERIRLLEGINAAQNYGVDEENNRNYLTKIKNCPMEELGSIKISKGAYYNHMSYSEILEQHGEIPGNWIVFAIERCPYRKIISFANDQLNFEEYKHCGKTMVSDIESLKRHIEKIIDNGSITNVKNIELYKDNKGNVCTEIMRFEKLEEEINNLMYRLNVSVYPKLKHLKKGMLSNNLSELNIFSRKQIQIINDLFSDEFNCFGYKMMVW